MSEPRNNEDDFSEWTPWEQQTLMEMQERGDLEAVYLDNTADTEQKLFGLFQGAAQCLAVLYKVAADSRNPALWPAFQAAAGAFTSHHKACVDYLRNCREMALEAGAQRRTKEILACVRRRRTLRREEILACLAGKSPPPKAHIHYRGSPRSRLNLQEQRPRPRLPPSPLHPPPPQQEQDLSTFREALGIAGSPTTLHRRRPPSSGAGHHHPDLQSFLVAEFSRNNKRPAPSPSPPNGGHDVTMDSPQHKRFRYT